MADTHTPDAGGPVEAAREWFDRDRVVHDDRCTTHGRALAAEVRRLREQLAACRAAAGEQDIRLAGVEAERDHYRAALAALREQTCHTCKHCSEQGDGYSSDNWLLCNLLDIPCSELLHRCGAWARREP